MTAQKDEQLKLIPLEDTKPVNPPTPAVAAPATPPQAASSAPQTPAANPDFEPDLTVKPSDAAPQPAPQSKPEPSATPSALPSDEWQKKYQDSESRFNNLVQTVAKASPDLMRQLLSGEPLTPQLNLPANTPPEQRQFMQNMYSELLQAKAALAQLPQTTEKIASQKVDEYRKSVEQAQRDEDDRRIRQLQEKHLRDDQDKCTPVIKQIIQKVPAEERAQVWEQVKKEYKERYGFDAPVEGATLSKINLWSQRGAFSDLLEIVEDQVEFNGYHLSEKMQKKIEKINAVRGKKGTPSGAPSVGGIVPPPPANTAGQSNDSRKPYPGFYKT